MVEDVPHFMIGERNSERAIINRRYASISELGWRTGSPIANVECVACSRATLASGSRLFLSLAEGSDEALPALALSFFDRG